MGFVGAGGVEEVFEGEVEEAAAGVVFGDENCF